MLGKKGNTSTYEVQIVVFDGEEWENDEPKHTVCQHHSTCICLSINSKKVTVVL